MGKDYNEIMCQAVDTLITHRLKDITYDKTIICEIVDDSNKEKGHYIVSDGTIKFDAYSESNKYRKSNQVYVIIPQGDYSQQKVILSKYTASNANDPMVYIPPLGTMVTMTDNLISNTGVDSSILANGNITTKLIWQSNLKEDSYSTLDIQNNSIYTSLGIKAKFKCQLNNQALREGNYGLRLDLFSDSTTDSKEEYIVTSIYLDTDDMFGDPYNFITYFEQEKMFDISSLNSIWGMNLYLYQNKNFKYYDSNKTELQMLPTTYSIGTEEYQLEDNIFVSDIYIAFGNDMSKISDNTFEIYTNNPLSYSKLETEDETYNFKNIYSIWYNKNENNEFLGFSDGIVDETYDEDAYRQEYETTMQGATLQNVEEDIPRVKEALQVYSNAEDLNSEIQILANRINKDLYKILNALEENLIAYDVNTSDFLGEQSSIRTNMNNFSYLLSSIAILNEDLDTESTPMVTLYKNWLKSYNNIYNELLKNKNAQVSIINLPIELNEYYNQIENLWEQLINSLDNLYSSTLITIVEDKPATEAYIDKSRNLYQQVLKYINLNIENIKNLLEKQGLQLSQNLIKKTQCDLFVKRLIVDKDTRNFDEEYQDFINKYANKYCIYWYRYEAGYEDPNERYLKPHWKRMEYPRDKNNNIIYPKPGMPIIQSNGIYAKKSEVGYTNIEMNHNVEAEKFKAILFFNHIPYHSNELIFENDEEIIDAAAGDLANALYIELGRNAAESFQLYGNNNQLMNLADANLIRQLRVRYDGVLEKDEGLINSWVYWYVPKNSSMLTYKNGYLFEKDFMYLDPDDKNLEEYLVNYKPGYDCFFKKIRSSEEISDDGTIIQKINEEDTYFYFLIEKYYSPTALNNEILCRVVKNGYNYETSQTFTFSTFGTSGTNYTLSVLPVGTQTALINIGQDIYPLELQANFYDYNNELIDKFVAPSITWSWAKPNKPLSIEDVEDANNFNHKYINGTLLTNGSQCLYNVIQCEVIWNQINETTQANQDLILRAYYPVPYSTGHYYIEGASTIIYDDLGKNPSYYKGPYKIYNIGDNSEVTDVIWKIRYFRIQAETGGVEVGFSKPENGDFTEKQKRQLSSIPKIHYRENASNSQETGYYLVPVSMYVENTDLYPVVVCEKNSQVIWAQPIFITQNRYGSSVLNSWDENLTIDEENGIILSTMMGAGYKDDKNFFNGVVMGDVRTVLDGNNVDTIGLYGFNEGAQSFGFKVDGTAFIGKSGHGRILMNGNKGQIQSAAYDQLDGAAGMLIDLDDGFIDMRGTKITTDNKYQADVTIDKNGEEHQSNIHIDVQSPYLTIDSNNGNRLLYIGNNAYYLKSDNYKKENLDTEIPTIGTGMKIDLVDGHIDAYNFKLTSNRLFISSEGSITSPYIRIKDNIDSNDEYDDENNLLLITDDKFEIQSGDYFVKNLDDGTSIKKGMRFIIRGDDSKSKIEAYSGFSMNLYDGEDDTHFIIMNTDAISWPFKIGDNFKVDWDGSIRITGGSIKITGEVEKEVENEDGTTSIIVTETLFEVTEEGVLYATGANISGTITASHISGSTIEGSSIIGGELSVGGGQLTANAGGVSIQNATITNCTIQNGSGDAFNFTVSSGGTMYGYGASLSEGLFENCTVNTLLTCNGDIVLGGRNTLSFGKSSTLYFGDYGMSCSTSFYAQDRLTAPTVACSTLTTHYYDGQAGSLLMNVNCSLKVTGTIECVTIKASTFQVGTTFLADYVNDLISKASIPWSNITGRPSFNHRHAIVSDSYTDYRL